MGGSGGQFTGPASDEIQKKVRKAQDEERERLKTEINELLGEILAHYNARDRDVIGERLEELADQLEDVANIQKTLYGGSVAKRTDIDGLSDTDALVVLDIESGRGVSPKDLLEEFRGYLEKTMSRAEVESVRKGDLAVTIKYHDGEEVQLLPAVEVRGGVKIPDESGDGWSKIAPEKFRDRLSQANRKASGQLVPTIKLAKGITKQFPDERRIKSYHLEALAVESVSEYEGPSQPRDLLLHVLKYASDRVKKPKTDITGQRERIDAYLGEENSRERQRVSLALDSARRRLESASSVEEWKKVLNLPDEFNG